MCKVTDYISSRNFSHLYDVCASQFQYFDRKKYWNESHIIWGKNMAIWERNDGSANGDIGNVGINMICLHRHLKLSKRTSPYSIIKELKEYFITKIEAGDIFDGYNFDEWQKQFQSGRFQIVIHKFKCLI